MDLLIASLADGLLLGFVYGLAAMGLALIWGVMDVINLSHGPIIALGMFGVYLAFNNLGLNPYLALFLVAIFGLLLGIIIYLVAVNRIIDAPHLSSLLATFAVNMIIIGVGTAAFTTSPQNVDFPLGQQTVSIGPITVTWTRILAALVALLIAGLLYLFLYHTQPGKYIRAVANNKEAAELMGIPSQQVLALSFGLGTMLAAISGGLIATMLSFSILSGGRYELKSFVIGVLGGLGNPLGALVGGLLLGFLEGLIPVYLKTTWVPVLEFGLFVVILLVLPNGLFGSDKKSVRKLGISTGIILLALFTQLLLEEAGATSVVQAIFSVGIIVAALVAWPQQFLVPVGRGLLNFVQSTANSVGKIGQGTGGGTAAAMGKRARTLVQRYGYWITLVLVLVLAIWPIATGNDSLRETTFTILLMMALASSLNILLGYTGYVSFGHIVFFGLGGYIGMYLLENYEVHLFVAMLTGGLMAGIIAFLLGKAILRLRGAYFALATIGVNEAAKAFINNFEPFGGAVGIELDFSIYQKYGGLGNMLVTVYWIMLALTIIIMTVSFLVKSSKFGLGLMAIRENEDAAEVMGVVAPDAKTWAYVLSAIGPGMLGVIFFFKTSSIEPGAAFRLHLSIETIVMVMLGGQGTLLGPLLGAAGYQVLRKQLLTSTLSILGMQLKDIQLAVAGLLLLVVILFVPAGVIGWLRNQFTALRRWLE